MVVARLREPSITRDLVTLAAAVVFVIGMYLLASVLVPVLFAIFLVLAFIPVQAWLMSKGLSKLWSNIIVIVLVVVGTLGIGLLIMISVAELIGNIPRHQAQIQTQLDSLASQLNSAGVNVTGEQLGQVIGLGAILKLVGPFLPSMVAAIGALAMSLIIFVYGVLDLDGVRRRLSAGLGRTDPDLNRFASMTALISRYITIRFILGGAAALGDLILLLFVGVDYALLWAFLSLVMSFIPYIGYWVALIPPVLLALGEHGWGAAVVVFLGYWIINGFTDNIIGPKMLGEGLNIAPAATVISILFWGAVIGPMGAILAMPLTLVVKMVLLERNSESRWLGLLISAHLPKVEEPVAVAGEAQG